MILFAVFWTLAAASDSESQVNYNEQDQWGGVCTTGRAQSPINVPAPFSKRFVEGNFLDLPNYFFMMTNSNDPSTAKYAVDDGKTEATVPWMGNRRVTLVQLHLHWGKSETQGSEHLIMGKAYAAETHLVTSYRGNDGSTKYMVFARVFKLGRDNPLIEKMIAGEKGDGEDRNISRFPLGQLYPANTALWLTYQGGLTTPPCSEIVHWVIVTEPLTISDSQLNKLRTMNLGKGNMDPMARNWRNTQNLNGRTSTLFVNGDKDEDDKL